jgi:protease-4
MDWGVLPPVKGNPMLRSTLLAGLAAILVVLMAGCISVGAFRPTHLQEVIVAESPAWFEWNRIALIDVEGYIGTESGAIFRSGVTSVADVKEKLDIATRDRRIKAVVLRVNTPGGEAAASDMIHQEIIRFRAGTGKPVVAALMGTAASGGYYVACAADSIMAQPSTVTGSIGVIMHFANAEGLFEKIGVRSEVIKSGELKDIGSPMRGMTSEERRILQQVNNALFARFIEVVRDGRRLMTDEQIAAVSNGRIFTAAEARDLNMVDGIGYLDDAIALARALAGIQTADVVHYRVYPDYNSNIYAALAGSQLLQKGFSAVLDRSGPAFLYLWSPGD